MRKGLLGVAALWLLTCSARAESPMSSSPMPVRDNLPTVWNTSDLSHLAPPFNLADVWPRTRLKHYGPGSVEAPRSYTGYGNVEWLLWWIRDQHPPTLLTTASGAQFGGDLPYDNQERTGWRATLGWWLNNQQTLGLEVAYLSLRQREHHMLAGQDVDRPLGDGTSQPVVAAQIENTSRLWGVEVNGRVELARWTGGHLDLLLGARHLQLDESLDVAARGLDQSVVIDHFGSHNQFWGGQVGLAGELNRGPWAVDMFGKVGLGVNHQVVDVDGSQYFGTSATQTGFLVQPSNAGRHVRDPFALLPEVGIHLSYRITDNFRVSAGYSILWLTETLRAGEQIDPRLTRGGGPLFPEKDSAFWAQGINVGLEFRW